MLETLIIGKDSKFGLTKDITILEDAIRRAGTTSIDSVGIRDRSLIDRLLRRKRAGTAIHIERVFPRWLSAADRHILIPNQERFPHRHLRRLRKIDLVLAKSHHAVEIFRSHGATTDYLGFTSEDLLDTSVERDWDGFFHLAGGSTLKGTEDLLALWDKHPEWPMLTVVQKEHLKPAHIPANVHHISAYVSDQDLRVLQNRLGIHLCPSRAEGWGHYLVESMALGALILTTDAPPMNEHVSAESAVLVSYDRTEPRRIGTSFFVDQAALEAKIEMIIAMPLATKQAFGEAARRAYLEIDRDFHARIKTFV
ncbi:glycosyltransferase [Pararhizobium sp.]|uniref:glycosyltransferase n=1 Tax=Pararhizobium sp. TaxID=1977563 RepID=UPI00271C3C0F|nr:glycosyltransferase [Pararhizobium sp.]MDO9414752.1 glycosyltransferase [Pararhizobium sp.]